MEYLLLKWAHVLLTIVALGANLTYAVWLNYVGSYPDKVPFVLRGIRMLDLRIVNPCYLLLLFTGVAMVHYSGIPFTTFWIMLSLVLYAIVAALGILVLGPTFRQQIALAETVGVDTPEYRHVARRSTALGIFVTIQVVLITFLMVVRPTL